MTRNNTLESVKTPKAVIYARYSSHNQTEQSIEGQLRVNYEYAKREGYSVVGEYIDRATTGTNADKRPAFQKMIADAKKRGFEVVIVYKLDRFARNRYDSAIYKHKLKACGVKVVSATENISDSPEGIILEAVLEASAEYYSLELSQKVKRGLKESAIKGTFTGGKPPFGYKVLDKRVAIDEDKAPYIKWAFEAYADGKSKKEIIKELNAKGVRSATGRDLTLNSFQHCLNNKKYIGKVSYGGVEYENTYPAIIDEELFQRVQARMERLAHSPASKKARQDYLLQGKAYCGMCGTRLVGHAGTSKSGEKYYYYACGKQKKHHTCKKKTEKKGFLEWYVVEQTVLYVLTPERINYIAERIVKAYDEDFNSDNVKALEKRIDKIGRDADRIFSLILQTENLATVKRYEKQVELLDLQKADLEIDLAKLKIANGIQYKKEDIVSWLKSFCKGDLMDENFRRNIIDTFVNSVYVYDDKIVIYYNVKEGKQVNYIDNCDALEGAEENNDGAQDVGVRISPLSLRHKGIETIKTTFFIKGSFFVDLNPRGSEA